MQTFDLTSGYRLRVLPGIQDGNAWRSLWPPAAMAPSLDELFTLAGSIELDFRVLELSSHDRPVLVLPVYVEKRRFWGVPLCTLGLVGHDFFDYLAPGWPATAPAGVLKEALTLAARHLGADVVYFNNLLAPIPGALQPYARPFANAYFDVAAAQQGWRELFLRKNKLTGSEMSRDGKKAKRDLDYRCQHAVGALDEDILERVAALHTERWRFDGVTSLLSNPRRLGAYRSCRDRAHLTVIFTGEEILAAHYGIRFGDSLMWHTPVINIKFLPYSPLKVLLYETVLECEREQFKVLDFGLGDEAYKGVYSNASRPVWDLFLPATPIGMLVALFRSASLRRWRQRVTQVLKRLSAAKHRWLSGKRHRSYLCSQSQLTRESSTNAYTYLEIDQFAHLVDVLRAARVTPVREHYQRIRHGQVFIAITLGPEILASGWFSQGNPYQDQRSGVRLRSPEQDPVVHDCLSLPPHRDALIALFEHFFLHRRTPFCLIVSGTDDSALQAARAAGFKVEPV